MRLWLQREQVEHHQFFTTIQSMLDKKKGAEAFEEYEKLRFPWIETNKKKDRQDHIKTLMKEVGKGALQITAVQSPSMKSRLKTRVLRTTDGGTNAAEAARIYDKLGMTVPIR